MTGKATGNKWFEERKDVFIRNAVRDFLKASGFFAQIFEKGSKGREIDFKDLDHLVGTEASKGLLWQLKELCHSIWGSEEQMDIECAFFDWLIGSIFHEGMKLKENAYMLQYYKPAYEKMMYQRRELVQNQYGDDYLELFRDATVETDTALARLNRFFSKASEQLRKILLKCTDNYLLLRLLVEKEDDFDRLWGPNSIPRLFTQMFSGQPEKGYCLAAKSYRDGNWIENARDTYQKALHINPVSEEAQSGLNALKDMAKDQQLRP